MVLANRIFLLSPAKAGGRRYSFLLRKEADFDLAKRLRSGAATIGEVYSFISGLYFRGKMAYATAFQAAPEGVPATVVITPGLGLIPPETLTNIEQLQTIAQVRVEDNNPSFRNALLDAAKLLKERTEQRCSFVLLGSVASGKYTSPLVEVFGSRLLFPADFVGRGDMSRGGLMLARARSGSELPYIPVQGAQVRGVRPPRLNQSRD